MYLPVFNQGDAIPSQPKFWNKCAFPTVVNGSVLSHRFLFSRPEEIAARPRIVGYYIVPDNLDVPEVTINSKYPLPTDRKSTTRGFLPSEISGYLVLATKQIIPNPFYNANKNALDKKQDQLDEEDLSEPRPLGCGTF